MSDEVRPVWKMVKERRPFCPVCEKRLSGNNSIVSPYKCDCGIWRYNIGNSAYTIEPE